MSSKGMEIIDREREREWLEQMDTILVFVCPTCCLCFDGIDCCPGCIIRQFLERIPHRTPRAPRTGPYGNHTGRTNLPNANDA